MKLRTKTFLKQLAVYLWCMGMVCVGAYGSFDSGYKVMACAMMAFNVHYFVSAYFTHKDLIAQLRERAELQRQAINLLESRLRIAEFGLSISRRTETHSPN